MLAQALCSSPNDMQNTVIQQFMTDLVKKLNLRILPMCAKVKNPKRIGVRLHLVL